MEIGKIYEFKKYFWFLYQTDIEFIISGDFNSGPSIFKSPKHITESTVFWSKEFNCKISHVSPNSLVMCLGECSDKDNEVFYKVLSSGGEVGWVREGCVGFCIEQCGQGAVT